MGAKALHISDRSAISSSDVLNNFEVPMNNNETNCTGNIANFVDDGTDASSTKGAGMEKWGKREEEDGRSQNL